MSAFEYTIGKTLNLKEEQEKTLQTPKLPANIILKGMFWTFDVLYGVPRSLPKILVLEILARYPYWAWENGAYHLLSKLYSSTEKAPQAEVEKALRHIRMGREAQDNEQCHMLLCADLCHQKGIRLSWAYHFLLPKIMTLTYFWITRIMYGVRPVWSFAMNAAFESHAEHEYMLYAQEHPEFENEPVESVWFQYYPRQRSLADLIRRIGLDERDHMVHSLEEVKRLQG